MSEPVSAAVLQALSHPLRLAVLVALEARPQTTTELAATLDVSPAALIHHVRVLRELGVVAVADGRLRPTSRGWSEIAAQLEALQDGSAG
jgi:DNA-binding transcriptional ArsR family regulator